MQEHKVVAIHQPNFFPWLGYFNKITLADIFIVMDNVQFAKSGKGTWSNRVRLAVNGQPSWVTMPVVRSYQGLRRIDEMRIDTSSQWQNKLLKTIQMNYSRAPFFKNVFPFLTELVNNPTDSLVEYNLSAISAIAVAIGLNTSKFILGSTLNVDGKATDLLISMVKVVGGTAYICGGGASGYQEDEKFGAAGLELIYQNFQHPIYPQFNQKEFLPGLSIIDTLMNCGFEQTKVLLNSEQTNKINNL